jgi:tripeptidyl-peptidase I
MGVYETGDAYDQESLNDFFTNLAPYIPNGTHPILQSIDGGVAPVSVNQSGEESALDLKIAYPLIYPQKIRLFLDEYSSSTTFGKLYVLDALDASFCSYVIKPDASVEDPEVAVNPDNNSPLPLFSSGGRFSNYFARPE